MTRLPRACCLIAGSLLICATSCGATTARNEPVGAKLAYSVQGTNGRGRIVAVDVGGTAVRQLLPTARHGWSDVDWSPDGSGLAAERTGPGGSPDAIFVATDGGGSRIVAPAKRGTSIADVRWSTDDQTLAFVRGKTATCGSDSLWLVGADGTNLRRLTRPTNRNSAVSLGNWSSDGKRLLYQITTYEAGDCRSGHELRSSLVTIGVDGSRQVVLQVPGAVLDEAWSPSGSQIAYLTCYFEGLLPCKPEVVDTTGTNRRQIGGAVNMFTALSVDWTPDSREVLIPYLCGPKKCVDDADYSGACNPKTWSGGLRAIDVATGTERSIISRSGCVGAIVLALSPSKGTIGFLWTGLTDFSLSNPMLVGRDGNGLEELPAPKVAGAQFDPSPALYLP